VKTTIKYRVKEFKTRVPLRVLNRKNLPRFGDAKIGEENVTLPSRDFISISHPDDAMNEDADDPTLAKTLANFISKQQERDLAREHDIEDFAELDNNKSRNDTDAGGATGATEKYVAPGARGGATSAAAGASSAFGGKDADGTENTIRVSNLTKAVTEDDLRDLFERFGRIHRISLPRVERENGIKEPRGFAYIAFQRHEDAEEAINRLQGHGYDHLIIKLEWAKPTKGDGGGGGGGGPSAYMSGYGKALVQDTKEKVYYASNLTGNS
jgi:translation initiation factor 3 subunit G